MPPVTRPEVEAHKEWLGYLQPVGLVVSPPALLAAQAFVNRNIVPQQQRLLEWVEERDGDGLALTSLNGFCRDVLEWEGEDLVPASDLPPDLEVALPDYNDTLRPGYAVREFQFA